MQIALDSRSPACRDLTEEECGRFLELCDSPRSTNSAVGGRVLKSLLGCGIDVWICTDHGMMMGLWEGTAGLKPCPCWENE